MTRLIILAYGQKTEHKRAVFAILSFWAWYSGKRADAQTLVFTDQPNFFTPYFTGLPVEYELLTSDKLEALRGPQQFVHRVKVAIIAQALREYPDDNVLFCDSDTFFVAESDQLLLQLQAGVSLMHLREYRITEAVDIHAAFNQAEYPRKLIDLINSRTFEFGKQEIQFRDSLFMWNSGVLGLTKEFTEIMPDILALNDALYAGTEWFTSEQIAFSLALQIKTRIIPSQQYVFHYWGQRQKLLMDGLLNTLLTPHFIEQDMFIRLNEVRQLTTKWWRSIELDKDREGAVYAFSKGEVVAGIKCTIKALFASPFNIAFAKDLVRVLQKAVRNQRNYNSCPNTN